MEPKPIRAEEIRTPSYPTRRDVLAGAAAFALATLGGQWRIFAATKDGKIVVAPIFEHGEGRGAMGCSAVTSPVFLSEEEAMQIVRDELGRQGIQLKEGITLKDTHVSRRKLVYEHGKEHIVEVEDKIKTDADRAAAAAKEPESASYLPGPLKLSGVDARKKVGVKFVTWDNYDALGGVARGGMGWSCDFKEAAGYVAETARRQSKEPIYLGVLYDPAVLWSMVDARGEKEAEARKLLREQVKDFVAWLKKQKVIEEPKAGK
jgi:hypothetical protein